MTVGYLLERVLPQKHKKLSKGECDRSLWQQRRQKIIKGQAPPCILDEVVGLAAVDAEPEVFNYGVYDLLGRIWCTSC